MSLSTEQINEAVQRYQRERDRYIKLTDLVYHICQDIVLNKLTIRATVQRRTKDAKSFARKLKKGTYYTSVDNVFKTISDLAGVRIITYLESDRELVVEEIKRAFSEKNNNEDPVIEIKDKKEPNRHYRATHCQVYLPSQYLAPPNDNLKGTTCEIQVCSILAHVFNEIEHDLMYKPSSGEVSDKEKELLNQLGLATKSSDKIIQELLTASDERLKHKTGEFEDIHDFVVRMGDKLNLDLHFSKHARDLYEELLHYGLNSPEKIEAEIVKDSNSTLIKITQNEYKQFNSYLHKHYLSNELEDNSSDLLLVAFLKVKYQSIIANHLAHSEKEKSARIVRIANLYADMKIR